MPPRKVPKFKPIIKLVEKDLKALDILATGDKLSFIDHIRRTTCSSIENLDSLSDDSLLRGIVTGCSGPKSLHFMKAAAESYKHAVESRRSAKLQFISEAKLNLHTSLRDAFLEKIPVYIVSPLPTPYPPLDHHIAESPEIRNMWYNHLAFGKQPDSRRRRHPMVDLDPAKLIKDIGPDESACFKTKSGEIVGLVIRNFCGSKAAIAFAGEVATTQLPNRRNVRVSSLFPVMNNSQSILIFLERRHWKISSNGMVCRLAQLSTFQLGPEHYNNPPQPI